MAQASDAIEAGIGSLKTRTEEHATWQGHAAEWTCDDVEAARAEANATARPRGPSKPTPDEARKFLAYVEKQGSRNEKKALSDVYWALLNSTEFKFNH